jgi:hypothetical protein
VAGVVLLADRRLDLAAPWAAGGVIVGLFGLKVLRPFSSPMWEWYRLWSRHEARIQPTCVLDHNETISSEEQGLHRAEESQRNREEWDMALYLALPATFGLFHGILWGPLFGALLGLDDDVGFAASVGAVLGVVIGPVVVAFIAGVTLACIAGPIPGRSWRARLARRCWIVAAPLLFVPCVWYCLRTMVRQRAMTGRESTGDWPRVEGRSSWHEGR